MANGGRRLLRAVGMLLLVIGVTCLVLLVKPGPAQVADWLGSSCRNDRTGPLQKCDTVDAVSILWGMGPTLTLIGFVLTLALRPEDKAPLTLDLRRFRRRR